MILVTELFFVSWGCNFGAIYCMPCEKIFTHLNLTLSWADNIISVQNTKQQQQDPYSSCVICSVKLLKG